MQILLNEIEQYIDSTILERGLSYFQNGYVQKPDIINEGEYEFIVAGSQDYTVQISLNKGTIEGYDCDCPYDWGPICKHVVAAIFYLQKDESKSIKCKKKKNTAKKKRQTLTDTVNELLEKASHDDLKQFILDKTKQNRNFRNMFLASFAHLNSNESKEFYIKQVKSFIQTVSGNYGFIDWSAAKQLGFAIDNLLETAEKQVEAKNYQSALFICSAIMEQLVEALQYADDSNGEIGSCISSAFDIMLHAAQDNQNEQIRKNILDYCLTAYKNRLFEDWDWDIDLLQLAAILIETENETKQIFKLMDRAQNSQYQTEIVQKIKYEVILNVKGEAEADQFLQQHITNSNLRRIAIQKTINQKDFEKAIKLAKDGIEHDMDDKPGLAKEWYDWLLKIAQQQNDSEKIVEYARYLLIDNFRNEQDYYKILKEQVKPENWKIFIENVILDIQTKKRWTDTDLIANIFIREEWWDRLWELVKEEPDFHTIEQYEKYLASNYAADLIDLYETEIFKYLENNVSRSHYQNACRYLRRMKKLGGRNKVNKTISRLCEMYPRRSALMEELAKV